MESRFYCQYNKQHSVLSKLNKKKCVCFFLWFLIAFIRQCVVSWQRVLNAKLEKQDEFFWEHEVDQIRYEMAKHVGLHPSQRDLAYVLHLLLTKYPHFFMNQNSDREVAFW